jgi:hypothetical protein
MKQHLISKQWKFLKDKSILKDSKAFNNSKGER